MAPYFSTSKNLKIPPLLNVSEKLAKPETLSLHPPSNQPSLHPLSNQPQNLLPLHLNLLYRQKKIWKPKIPLNTPTDQTLLPAPKLCYLSSKNLGRKPYNWKPLPPNLLTNSPPNNPSDSSNPFAFLPAINQILIESPNLCPPDFMLEDIRELLEELLKSKTKKALSIILTYSQNPSNLSPLRTALHGLTSHCGLKNRITRITNRSPQNLQDTRTSKEEE